MTLAGIYGNDPNQSEGGTNIEKKFKKKNIIKMPSLLLGKQSSEIAQNLQG